MPSSKTQLDEYKKYIHAELKKLNSILTDTTIGNFSKNISIPREENEFTSLYVGIQIMIDIIHEKIHIQEQLNKKLQEKYEERTTLLKSIGDAVVATDENGKVTFMNEQAEKIVGWSMKELKGKTWTEMVVMQDKEGNKIAHNERPLTRALQNKMTINSQNYYLNQNGTIIPIATTVTPVTDDKKIIGTISVFRDITEQKRQEDLKTEFLATAAHELRTPLSNVRWNIETLLSKEKHFSFEVVKKKLQDIYTMNSKMIMLVNDFLSVSRIDQNKIPEDPIWIDPTLIIKTVVQELLEEADHKSLKIDVHIPSSPIRIHLDPRRFEEVIQNLLSNAIKYNRPNGTINIKIEKKENNVFFIFEDTGMGIPEEEIQKIFTKFYRASNVINTQIEGTGLGLYIVKSMIDRWGGTIDIKSTKGKGSIFTIALPYQEDIPPHKWT